MSDIMDPSKLKVAELRAELQARGLDSKGNKPVLVDRLRAALEEEAACEEGDDVGGGEEEEEAEGEEEIQEEVTETQVETEEERDVPVAAKEPEPPQQEPEVAKKKSESPVKKTVSPQKEPESSPKKPEPEPSRNAPQPEPEVKTEPEDSAKLGYEDAPMEELADKSDAGNGMDVNVKEEELEIKEEAVEVKQEISETEESGSTSRRGEKRALSRSRSPEPAPDAKKQRPEVEEVRVEDEPEFDKTIVALDWYNSDLSLVISKEDFLSAQPLTMQGFGYVWHGVRATYGFTRGRVFFEAKVEDYMPVPQLEEEEQHPHVLRVGWSVDDAGLTLGEDPFSYGYGGTGKASTNLKFKSYGRTFGKGDVLGCFLDLESEPVVMSFTVNGQHQGIAYEVSHSDLGDQALFPHIVTKNTSFRVNFGAEPAWMEPLSGYTFTGKVPLEDRVLGTQAPEKREDAELPARLFYKRSHCEKTIFPVDTTVSDDESFDDEDRDPNYMPETSSQDLDTSHASTSGEPPAKKRCPSPAFVEEDEEDVDSDLEEEDEEEGMEVEKEKDKGKGKGKGKGKSKSKKSTLQSRPTTWKKQDIDNPPLPEYVHRSPLYVEGPVFYFTKFFTPDLIQHITYHTNLYAAQKDISTSFTTDTTEILNFIAILLYMGVVECPSLDDYWAMDTRVPQVADLMSSKRFRTMRRTLHFNDNTQAHSSVDRFFKIHPLFTHLNKVYRSQPHTPKQSIDEVMVGYKGRTAGNLRQYVKNKPDKWGFKLFCRASEDGFIHDMVMYQGATTLQSHGVPLTPEQETLGATSQIVTVLTSTIPQSSPSAIFADNFFTSLEVVRYLKSQNCRYTGTARDDRVGKPGLTPAKDLGKSSVPRGTFEYLTTDDGILALRWKDNKVVTMLSNDLGVEPVSTCLRYSKDTKKKEEVVCPKVIKSYNAHMGGIDKSDMLVHLYRTPMKSKRWYLRLFAYCLDISVCNGWLLYKRDCKALDVTRPLPLKDFRLQIYKGLRNCKNLLGNRLSRSNSLSPSAAGPFLLPQTPRGQRCQKPESDVRFDKTLFHVPIYNKTRQTCKLCSRQNHIVRSHIVCRVCKVHLCLNAERNCFITYHEAVA